MSRPPGMTTIRLETTDIQQFADWSGDHNPLHVNADFARGTFFGRPIAHGILTAIRGLGAIPHDPGQRIRSLEIEFRGAVVPGEVCRVDVSGDAASFSAVIRQSDDALMTLVGDFGDREPSEVSRYADGIPATDKIEALRSSPADRSLDEFQVGLAVAGVYSGPPPPAAFAADVQLTPLEARVLGLCSYLVGMELPGLRSLFVRLNLRFRDTTANPESLSYRIKITKFDPEFRLLETILDVATPQGETVATADIRSYVPFSPVGVDLDSLSGALDSAQADLTGKVALVCGGSRGLGADIAASLAIAGCHVYATYRTSRDSADDLAARLVERGATIEFLRGDVGDVSLCRTSLRRILDMHGRLDILVLNACESPKPVDIGTSSDGEFERYISRNLRLVRSPLSVCLPALQESHGTIVAVSSSFVDQLPQGFAHYVALKQAVEGTVRTACREYENVSAVIPRPPRLQTRWNDTPRGVLGAIPSTQAAAGIVDALSRVLTGRQIQVVTQFPALVRQSAQHCVTETAGHRVAISANFTCEPILPGLQFWFEELGFDAAAAIAPYGQVVQELLNPTSVLSTNDRGVNVVLLRIQDWFRESADEMIASRESVRSHLETAADEFVRAMHTHRSQASCETLLVLCPCESDAEAKGGLADLLAMVEEQLLAKLSTVPGLNTVVARESHRSLAGSGDRSESRCRRPESRRFEFAGNCRRDRHRR
ncbi:MAG: SDR family NAD(P)-dependent oxidoreductase [Planctomycetaceae bacterium]